MSLVLDEMRRAYVAQRGVSQGASVTLIAASGGYRAILDCARRCAGVIGTRYLTDHGTPPESLASLTIPTEEVQRALVKLAEKFSVALVDTVTDDTGTRYVLVWKIPASKAETKEENLDEY